MGTRTVACGVIVACVLVDSLSAQTDEVGLSFNLRATYTTSSRLFLNPESPSPDSREDHTLLEGVVGAGAEFRVSPFGNESFFAFSAEYLQSTIEDFQLIAVTSPPVRLPVRDGFRLIPIELSGHIYIPIHSDRIRIALGGGIGVYFGERILTVAGVTAEPIGTAAGFGIHVRTLIEYRVYSRFHVSWEMKFRDPEIETRNKFDQEDTTNGGVQVRFPQNEIVSRVNLDGITFSLGVTVDL